MLHHHPAVRLALLDHLGVVHGPVVLADGQVRSFVLVHFNHEPVEQFEIIEYGATHFDLPVELEFEIIRVLVVEELDADLLRYDLGADEVLFGEAQSHLLEDKFHLKEWCDVKSLEETFLEE